MSFLGPSLRNVVRRNLQTSTTLLRSRSSLQPLRFRQSIPFTRLYSETNKKPPEKKPESTPKPNESSKDAAEEKESTNEPDFASTKIDQDALTGDMKATPGGILSQYTAASEEKTGIEPAADSGSEALGKRQEYISSQDKSRQRMARIFTWGSFLCLIGGAIYIGRPLEQDERERIGWGDLPTGHSPVAYWKRFSKRFQAILFREPAFEKLLPPPAPEPYSRPYTLLLELDDVLVHSEWSREHGWRYAKRPGVDYFLGYLAQYYEVVVFTTQLSSFGVPVMQKLDPYHSYFSAFISREFTRYVGGKVVKDLSYLNRDLEKVIIIDTNPDSVSLQPENAMILEKWKGNPDDKTLIALLPFLEYIASQNFKDLRPILAEYKESAKEHNLTIAQEFSRREMLARQALQKTVTPSASSSRPSLSRLFGVRAPSLPTPPAAQTGDVVLPIDMLRQAAVENYETMKKYFDEHGQEILEDDKKREQQLLAEQKINLVDGVRRFFAGILGFSRPEEGTEKAAATLKDEGGAKSEVEDKSEVEEKK